MSRENEKVLAELRKFLELHNEELNDEKDFDRLAEQFLSQHNGSPDDGSMGEIETADDYLELAEQAASKKKRLNYLKKALELEPDHVDAQLQLILTEAEALTPFLDKETFETLQRDASAEETQQAAQYEEG